MHRPDAGRAGSFPCMSGGAASRKRFADVFVEVAAFLVVRAICGAIGFLIVLVFISPGRIGSAGGIRSSQSITERYDSALYIWFGLACAVAAVFAVIGPPIVRMITDFLTDH